MNHLKMQRNRDESAISPILQFCNTHHTKRIEISSLPVEHNPALCTTVNSNKNQSKEHASSVGYPLIPLHPCNEKATKQIPQGLHNRWILVSGSGARPETTCPTSESNRVAGGPIQRRGGTSGCRPRKQEKRGSMTETKEAAQGASSERDHRREAEELFDEGRILLEEGLLLVRKLERRRHKELILGFMAGFCLGYALVEGLRCLLT